jgi:hypothetical protein
MRPNGDPLRRPSRDAARRFATPTVLAEFEPPTNSERVRATLRGCHAKWSAWGANRPSAMKAAPMMAIPPASQASNTVPVMTAAEHSTMPIWNAAEASS